MKTPQQVKAEIEAAIASGFRMVSFRQARRGESPAYGGVPVSVARRTIESVVASARARGPVDEAEAYEVDASLSDMQRWIPKAFIREKQPALHRYIKQGKVRAVYRDGWAQRGEVLSTRGAELWEAAEAAWMLVGMELPPWVEVTVRVKVPKPAESITLDLEL